MAVDGYNLYSTRATLPTTERSQLIDGNHFKADRFGSYMIGGSFHKNHNNQ